MTSAATSPQQDQTDETSGPVIIGGGQAGLAAAWHLTRRGMRPVVLEASSRLGESWRSRWDSLRLFSPAQYDALPGMPFPAGTDTYPAKDPVGDYLERYAAESGLVVRLNSRVTGLSRLGEAFEVRTANDVLRTSRVVVATGPFQRPFVPAVGQKLDASVTQLHSADYRNPQALPDGPALVVGGGNSGLQIALELVAGREVHISVGENPPTLPQRIARRDLFWWLTRTGLLSVPATSRLGRRMQSRGEFVIGTRRRALKRAGVQFRPRLVDADGHTVRFADDTTLDVPVIVWATGYRSDYSWIQIPSVVKDSRVVHRRGVTDVPGLYFIGLSWQHTRGSALLGFVGADAAYLADHITSETTTTTRFLPASAGRKSSN